MRLFVALVVGAALAVAAGAPALAQTGTCVEPLGGTWDWDNQNPNGTIDVYIHPNAAENMEKTPGVKWSTPDLEKSVKAWLTSFQEQMGVGHPPIRYMGLSTVGWDQGMGPGTLHITPWLHPTTPCSQFPANGSAPGSPSTGARIQFRRSSTGFVGGVDQVRVSRIVNAQIGSS